MSEHEPQNFEPINQPRMTSPNDERKPRKIGCMTYCVVIVFALIILVWFNIFRPGPPLRISKETTYITEPLTSDGQYVDYFAALQQEFHPPEMQTDDNGYRVVFRALGDFSNETRDFTWLQKRYEVLGLDAINDKPTMTFVEPEDYFKNRYISHPEEFEGIIAAEKEKQIREREESLREKIEEVKADPNMNDEEKAETIAEIVEAAAMTAEDRETAMRRRMHEIENDESLTEDQKSSELFNIQIAATGRDYSFNPSDTFRSLSLALKLHENVVMQQWLEENNAALDLVSEQVKKPIFVMPYFNGGDSFVLLSLLLPDAQAAREITRGLQARASIRLGNGDIDGAIGDIVACYQLGRHIEKKGMLVEGLVGLASEGIGGNLPYDINAKTRASTEQLKHLQKELAQLSPQKGSLHKLECERYMCLDAMQSVMRGGSISGLVGGGHTPIEKGFPFVGMDWNVVFKKVNGVYDELIAGTYTYTSPPMNPARLLTLKLRSDAVADIFIALFLPAVDAVGEAYRRSECAMNMKQIVLAMHLYEREHGTLPPTFTVDENGSPLHSWRTLLLPYFWDETLAEQYSQIRLDEPWDSEHNRQFHERNIDVYRCPSAVKNDGESNYAVIVGDELLFTNDGKGQSLDKCGPIMLMLVERKDAVCWMRPDAEILQADAEFDVDNKFGITFGSSNSAPTPISSNHSGGANFGLRDGGVAFISNTIERSILCDLIRGTAKERP